MNHAERLAFGHGGATTETGTTARTGSWFSIHMIEDTEFSVLTDNLADPNGNAATGFVYGAGQVIFGDFTAFTLTSGKVRAYRQLR